MNILLLGGCGYIGSKLHGWLTNAGHFVEVVDIDWFGNPAKLSRFTTDYNQIQSAFVHKFNAVILLAGHSSVKMCEGNLVGCFNNNVRNFVNFLPKLNGQKFIYASSSSVYGNIEMLEVDEACRTYIPNNYYDLSKSEIDHYSQLYPGLNYYGLRFGTVNGSSPNLRPELMLNAMTLSAMKARKINVFNPEIARPILGINDLCRAVEAILNGPDAPGIYNLASFNSRVSEIAQKIGKLMDAEIVVHENPPEQIDNVKTQTKAYDFSINCEKFKKTFNFKFNDTVESIVHDVWEKETDMIEQTKRPQHLTRNLAIKYI